MSPPIPAPGKKWLTQVKEVKIGIDRATAAEIVPVKDFLIDSFQSKHGSGILLRENFVLKQQFIGEF